MSFASMAPFDPQSPPAVGVRPEWSALPDRLLAQLEGWLGAPVAAATTQRGGFSPGIAARVRTADGTRVFVKACGPEPNEDSPAIYRRERRVVEALPPSAPVPRLVWSYDEGEGGWVMLAFEDIEGWNPAVPWLDAELDRVLVALGELAAALTPSPIELEPATEWFVTSMNGWQLIRDERIGGVDEWSRRHLGRLAALEAAAASAAAGDTLLHMDVRADNVLLTRERVLFVDWPHAIVGAPWVDVLFFAPSVTMQGGPQPDELVARYPGPIGADEEEVTAVVAAIAGYFTYRALLPPPLGLPTVRAFQAAQGAVAREWLARRTGWR